jgi:hypothetical protein
MAGQEEGRGGFKTRPYGGRVRGAIHEAPPQRDEIHPGTQPRAPTRVYTGRQAGNPMLEYAVVAGGLLGEKVNLLLNFDSLSGYASILGAGVFLAGVGYRVKGFWGSFIALLIGAFLFLYMKEFFPF